MRVLPTRWQQKPAGIDSRYGTKLRHCHLMYKSSGKSGPKDQVALQYYTTTILRLPIGARLTRYRNCQFHNFARTISRHADGISRYSVPLSAGPLLPMYFVNLPTQELQKITEATPSVASTYQNLPMHSANPYFFSTSGWL